MSAQLKPNINPLRGDERKAGVKTEVDIARLKTIDLGELELPPVSKRADMIRAQLLQGDNVALVVSYSGGERAGDKRAFDLTNTKAILSPDGSLKFPRLGPSLLSDLLDQLRESVGPFSMMSTSGPSKIHVIDSKNGPVINGQFIPDPGVIGKDELVDKTERLVMFQPPQDSASTVDSQPKTEKEKLRPEDLQPLNTQQLHGAFTQILNDKDPGARERIGVFYQNGEVIAIPFSVAGKQGEAYSITAPKIGGAALTQEDKARIRETLGLADDVGIRETSKVSLTGNQTTFTPGVIGGQQGLHVIHRGLSLGIPIPVLGVLRREPKPEGPKQQ